MAYYAAQIANDFIRRGIAERITVDHLKLQKLVYLAHGWHLAFEGTPLIRENVQAWKHGPVIPALYRQCRAFGYANIDREVSVPGDAQPLDPATEKHLGDVWERYRKMSGIELAAMTHKRGFAWSIAREVNEHSWNIPEIPNEWIRTEFERRKAAA